MPSDEKVAPTPTDEKGRPEAAEGLGIVIAEVAIVLSTEELESSGALSAIATSEEPWLLAPFCPNAGQTPDQRAARVKTPKATSGVLRIYSPSGKRYLPR